MKTTVAFVVISALLCVCFAEDLCPCTTEYRPVCASNGVTYPNSCVFECAKRTDTKLFIVDDGVCNDKCFCPEEIFPVCTTIGTFSSRCTVGCYNRENPDKTIEILHNGYCPTE
ncbi:PREDICTED: serine protease inhibitor dipetalogastin-like [Nicrophorus vespilloides]|uniref:Serine protease inhibitor dipetalogastin-like n=1 Tax=Nicrophorus vespilloides TaxID=110193 RepID=A0ABM1MAX6_NICVS|nr:PREDICTED: serine protease inhibitor dipetalogastin-like [Nicrophorus vespilloides]